MKKIVLILILLATVTIAPAKAQVLCDPGTGHCKTEKKARAIWNHHKYRIGSRPPTVKFTTTKAGLKCEDVQTDVYFEELWAWGWERAWTFYRKAHHCFAGGVNRRVEITSWVDFATFTFWEKYNASNVVVARGSKHGKFYYNRMEQGMEECVAKIATLCFHMRPWIAMTLRGNGTHYVCGWDGDCYGTPPKGA